MSAPPSPPPAPALVTRRAVKRAVKQALVKAGPVGRKLMPPLTVAYRTWRRSLQLRMALITVVLCGALVGGFGWLVAERNTSAQIRGARDSVRVQLDNGREYATGQLTGYTVPSSAVNAQVESILSRLMITPEQGGGVIVAMSAEAAEATTTDSRLFTGFKTAPRSLNLNGAITPELRHEVAGRGNIASQIVSAQIASSETGVTMGRHTYLVFGTPVATRWGQLELYYLVPMDTAELVSKDFRTSVLLLGALLVVLLVAVVMLVTRLVVSPIRIAARTAQRLSAGLLDQRMTVVGEDDLALLASSFNQMAANLQRQITRLEEMSRLQRRFTSDVSHELRTPLTTVRMAADLLHGERESFDPAVARSAELLQHELDRFESLLSDLLEISRFDAGFAMLDAEPADLVPIVHRVVERLASVAERAGADVEVRAPQAPVVAEVDARRIERILRNLVGNAIEHSEGRPVVVTLAADPQAVAVTVRDNGIGLKPGDEKLVFNRFWRADPSRARQTGGTGLGLSIALEDARLHGGWLEAWGEPGRGAQFRLTVPARAGDRLSGSPLPLMPSGSAIGDTADIPLQSIAELAEADRTAGVS